MEGHSNRENTVLGTRCFVGDVPAAANAIIQRALSGNGGYGVFCNVHVLMTSRRQPEVARALDCAWAVFPDGAPVAWLQRRLGMPDAQRIGGPDLMPVVFDHGRLHGLRHALFGSTPAVVQALECRIRKRIPGAEIVHVDAPARGDEDDESVLTRVADARPHIVWCALGAPKQELWMARHGDALAPSLVLGVGAAFDFHAGTKNRAPGWMQRSGLEWFHRLGSEPRRLIVRYGKTNAAFVGAAAVELTRQKLAE